MSSRDAPTVGEPHDPYMATFDRGVGLTAYGLLFISPFLFGPPALAAFGMAFAHRDDAHSLMRSHFRFQMRIFWTTLLCLVIGAALTLGAGGLVIGQVYHFLRGQFPQLGLPVGAHLMGDPQAEEGWLLIAGICFLLGGLLYLFTTSAYGFVKLLTNRPIRHRNA